MGTHAQPTPAGEDPQAGGDGDGGDRSRELRAAAALKEENTFLRSVLSSMFSAVLTVDEQGTIRTVNHAASALLGRREGELVGRHVSAVMPSHYFGADGDVIADLMRADEEQVWQCQSCGRDSGPRSIPVLVSSNMVMGESGQILGAVCVAQDLTERKLLEANLRHAQKMESVGTLAAGIAHEINTPIQYVGDTVRFLQESFASTSAGRLQYRERARALAAEAGQEQLIAGWDGEDADADYQYLEEESPRAFDRALDGVNRVATIVRAMKDFAHPDQREMAAADLNQALASTLAVARNEYKYVADVVTELGPLPKVVCQIGDLNQVFLNLLVNAAHAIQDVVGTSGRKGRITIATAEDGDHVVVRIGDSGAGIPEEIRHRIFDPFFTTKEVGKGTGQGLAIARSIVVDKHHGQISFESALGRGTTFTIRLPTERAPKGGRDG